MLRKIAFGGVGVLLLITPALASALTPDEIQNQIQQLLQQIQQLKQLIEQLQGQGGGASCVDLTHNMGPDDTDEDTGGDVTRLQQFLAQDRFIYPEGRVTGYFGPATERAVRRWQKAHNIISSGDIETTGWGYVGPKTRAAMACGGQTSTDFSASPQSGAAPLTVFFRVSAGDEESFSVDFGDSTSGQMTVIEGGAARGVSHTYAAAGTYTAKLTNLRIQCFAAPCDVAVVGTVTITVTNGQTNTTFSATPTSGAAPLTVGFLASSGGGVYRVDFGDGTSEIMRQTGSCSAGGCEGPDLDVTHTYTAAGTYTAKLKNDLMGCAPVDCNVKATVTITVSGGTSATLSALPTSGSAPLSVTFTSNIGGTLHFGDGINGELQQSCTTGACSTYIATHTYTAAGTYTAWLSNYTSISSVLITVTGSQSQSPTVTALQPTSGAVGATLTITGTGFSSSSNMVKFDNGYYGSFVSSSNGTSMQIVVPDGVMLCRPDAACGGYAQLTAGAHVVYVQNANGTSNGVTFTVTSVTGPTFSATPTSGTAPLTVTFKSTIPVSSGRYKLDFGDGTSAILGQACYETGGCSVWGSWDHIYSTAGTYAAKLLDTSMMCVAEGCNVIGTATITVSGQVSGVTFSASPQSGAAPLAVNFSADGLTSGGSYSVEFGDGTSGSLITTTNPCYAAPCTARGAVSHTYASAGTYTAKLHDNSRECSLAAGCDVVGTVTITVSGQTATTTFTVSPTSGVAPLSVAFTATPGDADPNTFYIDYGDGGSGAAGSLSVQHTYASAGTYTASLKRTAAAGGATVRTATVTVSAPSGDTNLSVSPASGAAPLTVTATLRLFGYGSPGQPGCSSCVPYTLEWGDGTVINVPGQVSSSGTATHTHTYTSPGTYTVHYFVPNSTLSYTATVTVTAPSGTITDIGCSHQQGNRYFCLKRRGDISPLTVELTITDPYQNLYTMWLGWGDGASEQFSGGDLSPRLHTFSAAGTYTFTVNWGAIFAIQQAFTI